MKQREITLTKILMSIWKVLRVCFFACCDKDILSCLFLMLPCKISAVPYTNIPFSLLPGYKQKIYTECRLWIAKPKPGELMTTAVVYCGQNPTKSQAKSCQMSPFQLANHVTGKVLCFNCMHKFYLDYGNRGTLAYPTFNTNFKMRLLVWLVLWEDSQATSILLRLFMTTGHKFWHESKGIIIDMNI